METKVKRECFVDIDGTVASAVFSKLVDAGYFSIAVLRRSTSIPTLTHTHSDMSTPPFSRAWYLGTCGLAREARCRRRRHSSNWHRPTPTPHWGGCPGWRVAFRCSQVWILRLTRPLVTRVCLYTTTRCTFDSVLESSHSNSGTSPRHRLCVDTDPTKNFARTFLASIFTFMRLKFLIVVKKGVLIDAQPNRIAHCEYTKALLHRDLKSRALHTSHWMCQGSN